MSQANKFAYNKANNKPENIKPEENKEKTKELEETVLKNEGEVKNEKTTPEVVENQNELKENKDETDENTSENNDKPEEKRGEVTASKLYVRQAPSINSEHVAIVQVGTVFDILGEEEDFYKVKSFEIEGYCKKDFIKII